ncbi:5-hydroxytryptamine receptor 1A-like [Exaiptasia diaphana]|uniref:G-protein coupled receptors family 1 profile domain-containing protein n=1 Tax=Exaiptasia diaphana TaxID=2652724 RepID=A0A913YH40_EXADI|nr:5-hydroxytryptamine receptor 1A-like [Exaiptasia diaphana]
MNNSTAPSIEFPRSLGTTFAVSLIVVNTCSSIVAFVLNFMIILTVLKTPSMRTPSYILILCLAIADFGVGAVMQPPCTRASVRESLNLPRYKKTVKTMHYIMGTFSACFFPVNVAYILHAANSEVPESSLHIAIFLTNTLWLINSALNPVIYFWRIQDMRNAGVKLFRNTWCLHHEA